MKKIVSLLAIVCLSAGIASAQQLVAGAAKVDITPKESDLINETDIIRGKLYVRAIYVSDGKNATAIVGMDTHCHDLNEVMRRSSASTGVPFENFIISSTHTHSGGTAGIGADNKPS